MTKISLRVYNREIEAMVENGQLDEAIAHCKHILKTFPMHLETYRLLGKAFLEARRYSDAADIFQRVIMSVPDDFVSHVGMSIISDDEGKLDQATWHMERAFEVQPSNPAIQDELRKLYGRRDGVEPPKVRLTRDALANMYSQGALYSQAITEIRAVLANDPNRPDLQVMLARVYSRDGRKSQAIELCTGILRKYPYCFDALRILLDVMTSTDRLDITQSYRQRVWALDPYAAYTVGSIFETDKVLDGAVTLDQLSYDPQKHENENQPSWASSLGIKIDSDLNQVISNVQIEKKIIEEKPVVNETPKDELIASDEIIGGNEQIPEWMSSPETNVTTSSQPEDSDSNESELKDNEIIEMADIPEWLKDMAPREGNLVNEQNPEEKTSNSGNEIKNSSIDNPNIIDQGKSTMEEDQFRSGKSEEIIPEWLKEIRNLEPDQVVEPVPPELGFEEQEASRNSGLEQLQGEIEKANDQIGFDSSFLDDQPQSDSINLNTEIGKTDIESQPDWLKDSEPGYLRDQENLISKPGAEEPEKIILNNDSLVIEDQKQSSLDNLSDDDLPDWLKEIELPPEENTLVQTLSPEPSIELDYSNGKKEPTNGYADLAKPEKDDLEKAVEEPLIEEIPAEVEPTQGGLPSLQDRDASFAWLEGLAARQGANPEELLTRPEDRLNEPPEWVRSLIEGKATKVEDKEQIIQPVDSKTVESLTEDNLSQNEIENISTIDQSGEVSQRVDTTEEEDRNEYITSTPDRDVFELEDQKNAIHPLDETQNSETLENEENNPLNFDQDFGNTLANVTIAEVDVTGEKDVSDWLKEMESKEGIGEEPKGISSEENILNTDQTGPLPDWLQEEDKKTKESDWISEIDKVSGSTGSITDDQETVDIKSVMTPGSPLSESNKKIEDEPKTGHFIKPVTPDEWKPLQEVKQVGSSDSDQLSKVELITSGKLPGTGILSKIPGINVEKESATLEKAQAFIEKDDLQKALIEYGRLIKKGQMLEQVIHDLREITYRYPIEISIWQLLGDAFMRGNRLQDALDAYTKAEELLR